MNYKVVCRYCGTEDVVGDAYAVFSVAKQEWELDCVLDDGYCKECEDTGHLDLVPVNE